jgi:hypothetical protein
MDRYRATQLASRLAGAFPGRNVQIVHVEAWRDELANYSDHVSELIVDRLTGRMDDPPAVAQIRECADEVRGTTASPSRSLEAPDNALSLSEFLEANPRMRAVLERIHEHAEEPGDSAAVEDVAAKIAALKVVRHPDACAGSGKPVAKVDGRAVCPDCGADVPDIIVNLPKKTPQKERERAS